MYNIVIMIVYLIFGCCCLFGAPSAVDADYGMASYYGNEFHGRKTASGETYNQHDLTCAHRKLPFGTMLKVTNVKNNKSVIVRVNDRGPWVKGRIIDLSYAAAKKIGMVEDGVVRVKIVVVK
jgi:rare lipoprotein A